MSMVSATDLWWDGTAWPSRMLIGAIDGWQFLTNQVVFMPVARLALPVGYATTMNLEPLTMQALEGLAEWMALTPRQEPSTALFRNEVIDPLEAAGFLVRELPVKRRPHAVCDPDMSVVGLVMPINPMAGITSVRVPR